MKNCIKKIKLIVVFTLLLGSVSAQTQTISGVEITPYFKQSTDIVPLEAQNLLINKMGDILTKNGIIKGMDSKFIITANPVIVAQEVMPSAPPMYVYNFETTFAIGNGIDGNLFSSITIPMKGVGATKEKAYINAFRDLNTNNEKIISLIGNSKTKIVEYYNANCNVIIAEAGLLEKTNRFVDAFIKLNAIPEGSNCYRQSMAKTEAVFKKAIDFDCKTKLATAQQIWNAKPNSSGAVQAAQILMTINPNASCSVEVKKLGDLISKKMNANDAREWQVYYERNVGLEKSRIDAIKAIGVAYGKGQPRNITYITRSWW